MGDVDDAGGGTGSGAGGKARSVNDADTVPVGRPGGGAPTAIFKSVTTKTPTPGAELLRRDAGDVEATTVSMERSGAERVSGERIIMDRSGAKTLEARSAQLDRSGVVMLQSERAVLQGGSAVVVAAGDVRMVKSQAVVLVGGNVTVEGEGGARTLLHIGPAAEGVRPVLDSRGAAGFGAAFAAVVMLLGALLRRRRGDG